MNGLFELQVKDKVIIKPPETPGKQETLGMYLDMLRHIHNYKNIVGGWTLVVGEGVKNGEAEASTGFCNPSGRFL